MVEKISCDCVPTGSVHCDYCLVPNSLKFQSIIILMSSVLNLEHASRFADLALAGITREYPNAPGLVLNGPADIQSPRALHPAFYGCFDWHSSVHGHWMLARLLHLIPNLPQAAAIRAALMDNLTESNLRIEAEYFAAPNRRSFERTYGWTWLLKLA